MAEGLYRINVQNDPVNRIDPWGLLSAPFLGGYSQSDVEALGVEQQIQSQEDAITAEVNQEVGSYAELVVDTAAQQLAVAAATYYAGPAAGRILATINLLATIFDIDPSPPPAGEPEHILAPNNNQKIKANPCAQ